MCIRDSLQSLRRAPLRHGPAHVHHHRAHHLRRGRALQSRPGGHRARVPRASQPDAGRRRAVRAPPVASGRLRRLVALGRLRRL
eukprot:4295036-Prymnesium_polylepis.1